jgi:hypothetical protein
MRFELPHDLSPDDERAVLAALEAYFAESESRPDGWALAGRLDASGQGALQSRALVGDWRSLTRRSFARTGAPPLHGRGDAH